MRDHAGVLLESIRSAYGAFATAKWTLVMRRSGDVPPRRGPAITGGPDRARPVGHQVPAGKQPVDIERGVRSSAGSQQRFRRTLA